MILVGVAGWSYEDWEGIVYPQRKPRGFHPLPYLARYLDLIEINATFYAPAAARNAARWVSLVEDRPDFRFTAKLHREFTHGRGADDSFVRTFQDGLRPLVEARRLLALLVQFPASFRADAKGWERLERIRGQLPDPRLVLELRHRSWFTPQATARLAGLDVGLVHIDLPAARDHPPEEHASLAPLGYLRVHGRNRETWFDSKSDRNARYDYRYDRAELEGLADRMRRIDAQTEASVLVTNNHFEGQAVANALELKSMLTGRPPLAPEPLLNAFPDLRDLTRPEGQLSLF